MTRRLPLVILFFLGLAQLLTAQHLYYKYVPNDVVAQFADTANKVVLKGMDKDHILGKQFNYILKFYPTLQVKNIVVSFTKSKKPVFTKPTFGSGFKAPSERVYKVYFSSGTHSTLDSVLVQNLGFNAQLGLIANQVSQIEELCTGGFFDHLFWHLRRLTRKGRNKTYLSNEERTLEAGLGYQLLSLNRELQDKLRIENWRSTNGYTRYATHMRGQAMRPEQILNFIGDLPVYVGKVYK